MHGADQNRAAVRAVVRVRWFFALMAIVIGIFMHISTTILFEASDVHRFNFAKLLAIVAGTGLGVAGALWH